MFYLLYFATIDGCWLGVATAFFGIMVIAALTLQFLVWRCPLPMLVDHKSIQRKKASAQLSLVVLVISSGIYYFNFGLRYCGLVVSITTQL